MGSALSPPSAVLVRAVAESYPRCIRTSSAAIDLSRAREQHARYVDAIARAGAKVVWLPSLDGAPDSVFVEDAAVILGRRALITRPGAEARRAEIASVVPALEAWGMCTTMAAPATLDGGDVLRIGSRLFVGIGDRTNPDGFEGLARLAVAEGLEAIAVALPRGLLHLKSACSIADEETVLVHRPSLDPGPFVSRGLRVLEVEELAGANVLAIGSKVLGSNAAPRTLERLAKLGHEVVGLEMDELHKGDGAMTCPSIRLPGPGEWVT